MLLLDLEQVGLQVVRAVRGVPCTWVKYTWRGPWKNLNPVFLFVFRKDSKRLLWVS